MSEFKIGDRVEVISEPLDEKNLVGEMGKVVASIDAVDGISRASDLIGVEFDNNILGHDCYSSGKGGHCWWVDRTCLKKVEDISEETAGDTEEETKEEVETKSDTLEQKILTVLREEIGVEIGEEFDVYENGEKQWTCKFDEVGFSHEIDDEFRESGFWKQIVCKFHSYQFKKKPFIPKCGEEYFFLTIDDDDNENILLDVAINTWIGVETDYGRLALGNVFRTEKEALKSRNEMLERLEKLRNGE